MQKWREIGMQMLPNYSEVIRLAKNSMSAWIELDLQYAQATPHVRGHILSYARICAFQLDRHAATAACCAFIEHVVRNESEWPRFRQYFTPADIQRLKSLWDYNYREAADDFMRRLIATKPESSF